MSAQFIVLKPPTVPRSVFMLERDPSCSPKLKRELRAYRHRIDSMRTHRVRIDAIIMPKKMAWDMAIEGQ